MSDRHKISQQQKLVVTKLFITFFPFPTFILILYHVTGQVTELRKVLLLHAIW